MLGATESKFGESGPLLNSDSLKRVLFVDDSERIVTVVSEILRGRGLEVIGCNNARSALEFLMRETPDVIVCDVMMPGLNGFDFYRQVRDNPDLCNIPFIFLSALSQPQEVRFGKQLGCDDYLTKPFSPEDLVAVVKGKLTLSQQRQEQLEHGLEEYRRKIICTLSHELRTPLVSINAGTELLLDRGAELNEEFTQRLLQSVRRGGKRLERLIDDFMLLQQIQIGHASELHQRYRGKTSVLRIAEDAKTNFERNGVETSEDIKINFFVAPEERSSPSFIYVYDVQIIKALERLLSNAYKFGGDDGVVVVSVERQDDMVSITVRDRGPGLTSEAIEEACQIFGQIGRESSEQQGAGLGLPIATYLIHLNGGNVQFTALPDGKGFEVKTSFPIVN